MPDPVLRVAARDAVLAADPLDPGQVIEGDPQTSAFVLSAGGGAETGVWRCTPGRFRDVEVEESFVVLEGRATIAWEGGAVEIGAGDVCFLAPGTRTVWTVHETLLKGYSLAACTDRQSVP